MSSSIVCNLIRKRLNKNLFLFNRSNNNKYVLKSISTTNLVFQQKPKIAERNYFDTGLFIKELQNEGFTPQQAESLCRLFKEIVTYVINDVKSECVTKSFQELAIQQVMIHIASLKKDMIILEKSEFSALRNENEKIIIELKNLREQLQDEIIKLKSGFTLDLNLEKSRVKETESFQNIQHQKIESRVDTEIANLKAIYEKHKSEVLKWGVGTVFTLVGVVAAVFRLIKD